MDETMCVLERALGRIVDRKSKELKLFVWEEVLCNYTAGMMVALAPDVETARELLRAQQAKEYYYDEQRVEKDLQKAPLVCTTPVAFYIWGGNI